MSGLCEYPECSKWGTVTYIPPLKPGWYKEDDQVMLEYEHYCESHARARLKIAQLEGALGQKKASMMMTATEVVMRQELENRRLSKIAKTFLDNQLSIVRRVLEYAYTRSWFGVWGI